MKKRSVSFGNYITADYGWTVTGITLSAPEQKTNYVEKVGGDGSWDLSTVLTDGIPKYKNRTLTVTMELSIGDRDEREQIINAMVMDLDGQEKHIVLPDRPEHYLVGRIRTAVNYSDLAHAAVTITANVEPWFSHSRESRVELVATSTEATAYIYNHGGRHVVPMLSVIGDITVRVGDAETKLAAGFYKWPTLILPPGLTTIGYSGDGILALNYREGVLR